VGWTWNFFRSAAFSYVEVTGYQLKLSDTSTSDPEET
jgi:hypothetical protein